MDKGEKQPRSMADKRQRYFSESKTFLAFALMICGLCVILSLYIVYPQMYSSLIFNSRLAFHTVLDADDYYSCDADYQNFVYYEPDPLDAMYKLYVFEVLNAQDVLQKGSRPLLKETGPFGFTKKTYKYNITFPDPEVSTSVTFKEFNLLQAVDEPVLCENMYFALDSNGGKTEVCDGDTCECKSIDRDIVVVNPLFEKILFEDKAPKMLAHYSVDVFQTIKESLVGGDFAEAVRARLVQRSYKEATEFRTLMQILKLMTTANAALLAQGFTAAQIANSNATNGVLTCNLAQYHISSCPFKPYKKITQALLIEYKDIPASSYPSLSLFLDPSSEYSLLSESSGMPRWIGMSWNYRVSRLDPWPFTVVTRAEMDEVFSEFQLALLVSAFGSGSGSGSAASLASFTENQKLGAARVIEATTSWLYDDWEYVYKQNHLLQDMLFVEFNSTSAPLLCAPLGPDCVYQWDFNRQHRGANQIVTYEAIESMIDVGAEVGTNPNSFFKDTNGAPWYNAFEYCFEVYRPPAGQILNCTDLQYSFEDGLVTRPAGLWNIDQRVVETDPPIREAAYKLQSAAVKEYYFHYSCNVSDLIQNTYRNATDFHDQFVVKFLNKVENRDPNFLHDFTVGNWEELGVAQFGAGVVTFATDHVRTLTQLKRDGMWRFGREDFYDNLMEFSSWAVRQGSPQAWIYNITKSRMLLDALSRRDELGMRFRENIIYRGTTLFVDGTEEDSDFDKGDVAYTFEAPAGVFSCDELGGDLAEVCADLELPIVSSAAKCLEVQSMYVECFNYFTFQGDNWIDVENCQLFETSMTRPSNGIQCDLKLIYGNPHPYSKKKGNVMKAMMYGLTLKLILNDHLFCNDVDSCSYEMGGMFTKTTVRKVLFEGYTEPSVLYYLNHLYERESVSFQCVTAPFDQCGVPNYECDDEGVSMMLPNGGSKLLRFGSDYLPFDEYFAPHFEIAPGGELLWPHSIDPAKVAHAAAVRATGARIVNVRNPHWTAYPAWNTNDTAFNKFYQCQRRLYMGPPNQFSNCHDALFTGKDDLNKALQLKSYHENETIYTLNGTFKLNGTSDSTAQHPQSMWDGFRDYGYSYLGLDGGLEHLQMKTPVIFNKQHSFFLTLSQASFSFKFQYEIPFSTPLNPGPKGSGATDVSRTTPSPVLPMRRFVEDADSWLELGWTNTPVDANFMNYTTPVGMYALERFTGMPLFVDTPHMWGNREWGGIEFSLVDGVTPSNLEHRTFLDYDPVVGKAFRQAQRQQIDVRLTADAIAPNLFSSNERCTTPTKTFVQDSGYGCFSYVPLLWYEDSSNVVPKTFNKLYDHFYYRPKRAADLGTIGITVGVTIFVIGALLLISEQYHRRRFNSRIYVD